MRKLIGIVAALALGAIAFTGCNGGGDTTTPPATGGAPSNSAGNTPPADAGKITIAWAKWKPSDYLDELSAKFTKDTGIKVEVKQIEWKDYQTKIQTDAWGSKSADYDLIVGDSQWLGRAEKEGHYEDLTEWAKTNVPWAEIDPSARKFYCDYNGKTIAVPCEADAIGFAYRKDWFEDPKEKDAFKAKYKRDLAVPKTWDELKDIAEFFTRPDKKQYGVAVFYKGGGGYDGITMGFDQVLWSYGAELADPATGKVEGAINSPTAVKALDFYTKTLKAFTPPGSEKFYFDECLSAFTSGQVAMTMDWYTFFPGLTSADANPQAANTGYFAVPGAAKHFVSLGGQGLSISSYSKNKENAKKFLAWFCKRENQQEWAKLGGLTCNTEVLKSDDFKKAAPFNEAFAETVPHLKDFYNNPVYADLLDQTQTHWNAVVTGSETSQQAMDAIAKKHTETLTKAGLLK